MKIRLVLFIVILISFFSCKKVLSTNPTDSISESNYYINLSQITAALAAIYDPLTSTTLGANGFSFFGKDYMAVLNVQADEMYNRSTLTSAYTVLTNSEDNTNGQVADFWNGCYIGIERANVLLANIENARANTDSAAFNSVMGEALFMRGYYHFLLVQYFGDIPIKIVRTVNVSDVNIARSPIADVYAQIIKDMTAADSLLYPNYTIFAGTSGRVVKTVAEGMLARVCLFMAGYPRNNTAMYAESLKWSNKVIASGLHSLNTAYDANPVNLRGGVGDSLMYYASNGNPGYVNNPYSQIFLTESRSKYLTQENMWETDPVPNTAYSEGSTIGGQYSGPQNGTDQNVLGRTSNQALTSGYLYASYQSGDLRRDWNCAPYSYTSATPAVRSFQTTTGYNNLYGRPIGKWRREYEPLGTNYTVKTSWTTGIKFPLLRYTDVLMMNAEAELHVNGTTTNAYNYINKVRERAFGLVDGTSPVKTITLTSGGSSYTSAPTITISGAGKAAATATVSGGKVTAITITNPGIGYATAPTITFTGGGGTGAAATTALWSTSNVDLPTGLSVAAFQDSIGMERLREFPGEGLRKSDLIRWGTYFTSLSKVLSYNAAVGLSSSTTSRHTTTISNTLAGGSKFLLFPIPASEINTNKLATQNPGW